MSVLLVVALVAGGVVVAGRLDAAARNTKGSVPAEILRRPGSHTVSGSPDANVTVVHFLDYQSPEGAEYQVGVLDGIETDYSGHVTVVTRNYPMADHPLAELAARVTEAAHLQGKFREMHSRLYDDHQAWAMTADGGSVSADSARARARFDGYAVEIGLDLDRFHRDLTSAAVLTRIDEDRADGARAGVISAPTIFVNGRKFEPHGASLNQIDGQLRTLIRQENAL